MLRGRAAAAEAALAAQPVGQGNNSIAWLTATPDCRLPTPTLTVTPDSTPSPTPTW